MSLRVTTYRVGKITQGECTRCGACCCNSSSNKAEGFTSWVEVTPRDAFLTDPRAPKLLVYDEEGVAHLKLTETGRCVALRGRVGARVECSIYRARPKVCRIVEAGSDECMAARADRGLD